MWFRLTARLLCFMLVLLPAHSQAQSMSIIGGGSYARNCYMAATLAIQMHAASREDLQECNMALAHGKLQRKDLLATYVNRGIVHGAMEDYQSALQDYNTAIDLGPQTGEVYVNLGNIYLLAKKYDLAIAQYTIAIELTMRQDHIAYFNRAMAYENNLEFDKAETDYRKTIELSPAWPLPQLRLERLLQRVAEPNS
ncbi:MAG: tetratricopeptide repeat protein [Gammaproteobacteria bacterium]|nr:tetratricopeptide repeat protein [Gammaproteobacteria bacterium]